MNRRLAEVNRTIFGTQTIQVTYKDTSTVTLKPGICHINDGTINYTLQCNGFDYTLSSLGASQ